MLSGTVTKRVAYPPCAKKLLRLCNYGLMDVVVSVLDPLFPNARASRFRPVTSSSLWQSQERGFQL